MEQTAVSGELGIMAREAMKRGDGKGVKIRLLVKRDRLGINSVMGVRHLKKSTVGHRQKGEGQAISPLAQEVQSRTRENPDWLSESWL